MHIIFEKGCQNPNPYSVTFPGTKIPYPTKERFLHKGGLVHLFYTSMKSLIFHRGNFENIYLDTKQPE